MTALERYARMLVDLDTRITRLEELILKQKECQHESDGICKDNSGRFELGCYKCIKCGEYYK